MRTGCTVNPTRDSKSQLRGHISGTRPLPRLCPRGPLCSSEGSHLPREQFRALAAIRSYCLELREGFKDNHGAFLCLSP